jgi:phospholipid transport system transporter-binding protein
MLVLPDTVTVREARDVMRMLEQNVQRDGHGAVTVDASALRDFDTAALAVLLECSRQARSWGKALVVHGAPPKLGELAALYGVDKLLAIGAGAQAAPGTA